MLVNFVKRYYTYMYIETIQKEVMLESQRALIKNVKH